MATIGEVEMEAYRKNVAVSLECEPLGHYPRGISSLDETETNSRSGSGARISQREITNS